MSLQRSNLAQLSEPETFHWMVGIEDTFIVEPWPKTNRILDEYELTGHYEHFREDIGLMAHLGVKMVRYGLPWYRINPSANQWNWEWADGPMEFLLYHHIDPVVDLVHYGLPSWIKDAYENPDYPKYVAEYAFRIAERYKGLVHCYTPLNEPRITAWYCGKLGWWPPHRKGWKGFVNVMIGACRGMIHTVEALQSVDPEIVPVHVDATDLYESADPSLQDEVHHRQEIVFLALDLISGKIVPGHSLYEWLLKFGARESDLEWFQERAIDLAVVGINLYPMFSRKILHRSPRHGLRIRMPYSTEGIVERLSELYWERYHSPLFITETASVGSVKRREQWLRTSVEQVKRVRSKGIPLAGYTWWPLFALVTWAYRQGTHPPAYYLKQMGLWDLHPDINDDLCRVKTPLVQIYRDLVAGGCDAVGQLQLLEQKV